MNDSSGLQRTGPQENVFFRYFMVFLLAALGWDVAGLDLHVMSLLGDSRGFVFKNHPLLALWLHDRGKQLALVVLLVMVTWVWRPVGPWKQLSKDQRMIALIAVLASLLSVSLIKRYSLTSCPWELEIFGGVARYIPHWQWGVHDGGGGRCFPGGHASSALGLMPASLPFLVHSHAHVRKMGRWIFLLTSGTGLLFGLVQTLRGAHYPSHTLWTAVICWTTGVMVYLGLQRQFPAAMEPRVHSH